MANLLTSLILAAWVSAIAILSVQNAAPVSLKFLVWQSIQMPVGVALAFSAGVGILGMAVTQPLWDTTRPPQPENSEDEDF
ncbi:MAG: LapA family protein [Leptolyngbyaceae bacterium]|nr:LapA family protein [Leptolyngbyaceae bacterium]